MAAIHGPHIGEYRVDDGAGHCFRPKTLEAVRKQFLSLKYQGLRPIVYVWDEATERYELSQALTEELHAIPRSSWGGAREGAGRPRKYRYLKMEFDSRDGNYHGFLPNGTEIVVDGDVYAEAEQDARKEGAKLDTIESPLTWESVADDESVRIVKWEP